MNGADTNLTPSDLIILFVDGEASDLERTLLFNALVGNAELQAELADVIRINSAAAGEMFETLPPASVTRALFRRVEEFSTAGGATAAGAGVAAAGPPPTGTAPDRPPVASTETAERRRRHLPWPLLTGALGLLLGFLLFHDQSDRSLQNSTPIDVAADRQDVPALLAESSESDHQTGHRTDQRAGHRAGNRVGHQGERPRSANDVGVQTNMLATGQSGENGRNGRKEERASTMAVESVERIEVASESLTSVDPHGVVTESEEILGEGPLRLEALAVTAPRFSLPPLGQSPLLADDLASQIVRSPGSTPESERVSEEFSFFLRGGNEVRFAPDRLAIAEASRENLENLAIGGYYHLDEMHAIGVQGGRDFHPFYRQANGGSSVLIDIGPDGPSRNQPVILSHVGGGGNGGNAVVGMGGGGDGNEEMNLLDMPGISLPATIRNPSGRADSTDGEAALSTLDPTIEWLGVGYRFRAPGLDRLGLIRPEVQAALGISAVGPIGRASIGLAWKPGTHISLSAGVEGTGVIYSREGETYTSRRIGVVYGVEIGW